jgi:hypothetical protein
MTLQNQIQHIALRWSATAIAAYMPNCYARDGR